MRVHGGPKSLTAEGARRDRLCYFISACYVASAVKKVKLAAEETGRDGLAMDEASTSSDGVNQAPVKSVPEAVIR